MTTLSKTAFRVFYLLAIFCLIFPTVRVPVVKIGISDLFILCALFFWGLEYLHQRGKEGWGIPFHILWFAAPLVLLGGVISSYGAVSPITSLTITAKTVFVLTVWISLGMVVVRQGDLYPALLVFLCAVGVCAAIALVDRWAGTKLGDAISGNQIVFFNRSNGTLGHPNELGFMTSVALPLCLGTMISAWTGKHNKYIVALCAGVLLLSLPALFYSGSVASWLSAVVSTTVFGVIWFLRATPRLRLVVFGGFVILVAAGSLLLIDPGRRAQFEFLVGYNLNRVLSKTGPDRASLLGGAMVVIARNPWVGAGMDQTGTGRLESEQLVMQDMVHNTIIGGWLGGGFFVFLGLLVCYLVVFITALKALQRGFRTGDWLAVGLGACALGWMLVDQTQPNLHLRYTWLTLAWMFGMGLQIDLVRRFVPAQTNSAAVDLKNAV